MAQRADYPNPYGDSTPGPDDYDNPYEQPVSPVGKAIGASVLDVAKQIPAGLVAGAEAAVTFPAQALGFAGKLVNKVFPGDPEREAEQQAVRDLAAKQGGAGGVSQYLPQPETRAGQFARTGAEFVPSVVAAGVPRLGARTAAQFVREEAAPVARAAGVGATTGLASEAAGQATEGTAAEPYARLGGAIIAGPAAARASEAAAARSALNTLRRDIEPATNLQYDAFRNSGFGISPAAAPQYAGVLRSDLNSRGLTTNTAERTHRVLDGIEANPFTTPAQFQGAYKELGSVARSARDGEERLAANIAQERLLGFLENMPPSFITGGNPAQGAAMLRDANANWAAAKRAENVSDRIVKGEQKAAGQYSGLGLENELRRRIGSLADPTARSRGFTEQELRRFAQFGEGTTLQNIRRYATGALSGRGGIGVGGLFLGGGGLASYLGADPITSGALGLGAPAAGLALALAGNRSARSRARDIERAILSRAPMAAGRIPQMQGALPLAMAPPTLATIGESYDEGDNPLRLTVRPNR